MTSAPKAILNLIHSLVTFKKCLLDEVEGWYDLNQGGWKEENMNTITVFIVLFGFQDIQL